MPQVERRHLQERAAAAVHQKVVRDQNTEAASTAVESTDIRSIAAESTGGRRGRLRPRLPENSLCCTLHFRIGAELHLVLTSNLPVLPTCLCYRL